MRNIHHRHVQAAGYAAAKEAKSNSADTLCNCGMHRHYGGQGKSSRACTPNTCENDNKPELFVCQDTLSTQLRSATGLARTTAPRQHASPSNCTTELFACQDTLCQHHDIILPAELSRQQHSTAHESLFVMYPSCFNTCCCAAKVIEVGAIGQQRPVPDICCGNCRPSY